MSPIPDVRIAGLVRAKEAGSFWTFSSQRRYSGLEDLPQPRSRFDKIFQVHVKGVSKQYARVIGAMKRPKEWRDIEPRFVASHVGIAERFA